MSASPLPFSPDALDRLIIHDTQELLVHLLRGDRGKDRDVADTRGHVDGNAQEPGQWQITGQQDAHASGNAKTSAHAQTPGQRNITGQQDAHAQTSEPRINVVVLEDKTGAITSWAMENPLVNGVFVRCTQRDQAVALRTAIAREAVDGATHHMAIAGLDEQPLDLEGFLDRNIGRYGDNRAANSDRGMSQGQSSGPTEAVTVVIGRLPKSLRALDEWARSSARVGATAMVLGGATKHMTKSMNTVLADSYAHVHGLRGKGKFRCLQARDPRHGVQAHVPQRARMDVGALLGRLEGRGTAEGGVGGNGGISVELHGVGGVFSGAKADRGGQALAAAALRHLAAGGTEGNELRVVDLGCGNGTVAASVLAGIGAVEGHARVATRLIATDIDLDAVRSTTATLQGNANAFYDAHEWSVTWDDAASAVPDASQDLVLLNPPFHQGTSIDPTLVRPLVDAAARIVKPQGTLLLVHNSHLRYRPVLEQRFRSVRQVSRDKTFTVLAAAHPGV